MKNKKHLPDDGLKVVISSIKESGKPFLNVLMPNGEELPFVRSCTIKSDYAESPVTVATIEVVVDIRQIAEYEKEVGVKEDPKPPIIINTSFPVNKLRNYPNYH